MSRRGVSACAVVALAALLAVPAHGQAPAGGAAFTFEGPDTVRVRLDGAYDAAASAFLRGQMDGDRDGEVGPAEAAAHAESMRSLPPGRAPGATSARVLLDGREQAATRVASLRLDAEGPVDGGPPVQVAWDIELSFAVAPGSVRHRLEVDPGNFSRAGFVPWQATDATFSAAAPWRLAPEAAAAPRLQQDGDSFLLADGYGASTRALAFTLEMQEGDAARGAPSAAAPLALAACALALAALRLRRR